MELLVEKTYTAEEYFELEKKSVTKHEFHFGKLTEMPGESKRANKIGGNFYVFLKNTIKGMPFEVFNHDIRLNVIEQRVYRYPDIVIAPTVDDGDDYAVTMPILIVEVLSPSTEATDLGRKRKEYTSLSSLMYYLIVSQDEMLVQLDQRNGEKWEFQFFEKTEDIIQLPHFQASIRLSDIYYGIKF